MTALPLLFLLLPWIPSCICQAGQFQFHRESGPFAGGPSVVNQVVSMMDCARRCTTGQCCSGFSYHSSSSSCRLFPHGETCVDETRPSDSSGAPASYRMLACNGTCARKCETTSPSSTDACPSSLYFDQATGRCRYDNTQCTTTVVPTTQQPTTTTVEPTTAEPTTAEPATTAEPTTAEPTTAEPTTAEPATTAEPTTAEPTTAEPATTAEQTTAEPTTAEPTTAEPTTAEPATTASGTNTGNQCDDTSFTCPTNTAQFHFAKDDNCRQFYKCSNGCPVVFDCPASLSYNPAILNCDWDASTGCTAPPL